MTPMDIAIKARDETADRISENAAKLKDAVSSNSAWSDVQRMIQEDISLNGQLDGLNRAIRIFKED